MWVTRQILQVYFFEQKSTILSVPIGNTVKRCEDTATSSKINYWRML